MSGNEEWRFEELAALAAELVNVEGSSKRVRWSPKPRTIRYYTTIGLLDSPLYLDGRVAYYGRKHLAQIVAIKKLQARGMSLAQVQTQLAGLPDKDLFVLAGLPQKLPVPTDKDNRKRFWDNTPTDGPPAENHHPKSKKRAANWGMYVELTSGATLYLDGACFSLDEGKILELKRAAKPLCGLLANFQRKRGE